MTGANPFPPDNVITQPGSILDYTELVNTYLKMIATAVKDHRGGPSPTPMTSMHWYAPAGLALGLARVAATHDGQAAWARAATICIGYGQLAALQSAAPPTDPSSITNHYAARVGHWIGELLDPPRSDQG